MNAIETEYKGYLFRSRLEARWAVFFDTAGIEWKYESEGYEVGEHRYLPDFWLPGSQVWVEVKGDPDGLRKEHKRMCGVLGQRSPLPGFAEGKTSLLVLGDIPDPHSGQTILHPCLTRASGVLARTWGFFIQRKGGGISFHADREQSVIYLLFGKYAWADPMEVPESTAWNVQPWHLDTPGSFQDVNDAYRTARKSRFEHGAQGAGQKA